MKSDVPVDSRRAGAPDRLWRWGRRIRDWLQARRAWAPFEPMVLWAGPRLIHPPAVETVASLPGGLQLTLPPGLPAAQSYVESGYESELTSWFLTTVQPGWTVVDGGANVGYYSLLLSHRVGPSGRVLAFEPDPTNFEYLLRNLKANHCENVRAFRVALSDRVGTAAFVKDRYRAEGHLVAASARASGTLTVDTQRLDEFLERQRVSSVQLMKLDLEGGEVQALRGMATLRRTSPDVRLILEYNPRALRRAGFGPSDLFETLHSLGFTKARSIEVRGPEIRLDASPDVAGFSQNLEVWA